jgi:Sec-independent protein secretion pathway component TatC
MGTHRRFLTTLLALLAGAFVVAAVASPPDPFTQLLYAGALAVVSLPLAYWLVYRGGAERLTD